MHLLFLYFFTHCWKLLKDSSCTHKIMIILPRWRPFSLLDRSDEFLSVSRHVVGPQSHREAPKGSHIHKALSPESFQTRVFCYHQISLKARNHRLRVWRVFLDCQRQCSIWFDSWWRIWGKRKAKEEIFTYCISRVNSLWIVAWVSDSYSNEVSVYMWPLRWQHTVYTFHCLTLWADRHVCYVLQLLVNIFWSWMLSLKRYRLSIPIYTDILVISPFISVYYLSIHICVNMICLIDTWSSSREISVYLVHKSNLGFFGYERVLHSKSSKGTIQHDILYTANDRQCCLCVGWLAIDSIILTPQSYRSLFPKWNNFEM